MEENTKKLGRVQQELSDSLNLSEEDRNSMIYSEEEIEREQVKDTPFWCIGNKEKGYFLVMGKHRITEIYQYKNQAYNALDTERWKIILNVIAIMMENSNYISDLKQI